MTPKSRKKRNEQKSTNKGKHSNNKKEQNQPVLNILFDLDATLISSQNIDNFFGNFFPEYQISSPVYNQRAVLSFKKTKEWSASTITDYRPFATMLIKHVMASPRIKVGVWSSGSEKYVRQLCNLLFGPNYIEKLSIVISRHSDNPKYTSKILNTGEIFDSEFENTAIKDMNFLFKHPKYKHVFQQHNTLLIDDNVYHYLANKGKNIIHIRPWIVENSCDFVLLELGEWILKNLESNPNSIDVNKFTEFVMQPNECDYSGSRNSFNKTTKAAIQNNQKIRNSCAPKIIKFSQCNRPENQDEELPKLIECANKYLIPFNKSRTKISKGSHRIKKQTNVTGKSKKKKLNNYFLEIQKKLNNYFLLTVFNFNLYYFSFCVLFFVVLIMFFIFQG